MSQSTGDAARLAPQRADDNAGCRLLYRDLREWLAEAERMGAVKVVKGANWERDIGQVVEVVCHDEGTPSIVFDDVQGCSKGFRVLVNWFTGTRKNLCLGFPPELNRVELSRAYHQHTRGMKPVPHVMVDDGPVRTDVTFCFPVDMLTLVIIV